MTATKDKDHMQDVYDEARRMGILDHHVDAAEARAQGVTSVRIEARGDGAVLIEKVSGQQDKSTQPVEVKEEKSK